MKMVCLGKEFLLAAERDHELCAGHRIHLPTLPVFGPLSDREEMRRSSRETEGVTEKDTFDGNFFLPSDEAKKLVVFIGKGSGGFEGGHSSEKN